MSANYRLCPAAWLDDHVVDAEKVLVRPRERPPAYGADPSTLVISGSSAGGTSPCSPSSRRASRSTSGHDLVSTPARRPSAVEFWVSGLTAAGSGTGRDRALQGTAEEAS